MAGHNLMPRLLSVSVENCWMQSECHIIGRGNNKCGKAVRNNERILGNPEFEVRDFEMDEIKTN